MDSAIVDSTTNFGSDDHYWQTSCNGLSSRLGVLRMRGLWTDCILVVGSAQVYFATHRVLLASASPVLEAMLYGPMANPDQPVHIPNIEHDIFNQLLEFIYTDNIRLDSCNVARSLYAAAHYLNMPHVVAVCKAFLFEHISLESAVQTYEFAKLFGEEKLMDISMHEMIEWTDSLFKGESICLASVNTLEDLFAQPDLGCQSELDLFRMATRWVLANTTPIEYDKISDSEENKKTGGDEKNLDNVDRDPKKLIRKALQQIRFLTMEPKEFAKCDMTMLLTEKEILTISLNLHSKDTYTPMPEGFSASDIPRCSVRVLVLLKKRRDQWIGEFTKDNNIEWYFKICKQQYIETGQQYKVQLQIANSGGIEDAEFNIAMRLHNKKFKTIIKDRLQFRKSAIITTELLWKDLIDPKKGYTSDLTENEHIWLKVSVFPIL